MILFCCTAVDYDYIDKQFIWHYSHLLKIILDREYHNKCVDCFGVDDPPDHTCKSASSMVRAYGGVILRQAKFSEPYDAWRRFIFDIFAQNLRKDALKEWLSEFRGVEHTVTLKKDEIADCIERKLPKIIKA